MPKKMHVCAAQILGHPAARFFLFAPAREAKFNLRPTNGLPDYQVYTLVGAERSCAQYDQPISIAILLRRVLKIVAPIHAVINRGGAKSEPLRKEMRDVITIAENHAGFFQIALLFRRRVTPIEPTRYIVSHHCGAPPEHVSQCEELLLQRTRAWKKI